MFFQSPNLLPTEVISLILNKLSSNEVIRLSYLSKGMNQIIKTSPSLQFWKDFGANDFDDFITRIKKLPENYYPLVPLIARKKFNLTDLENLKCTVNSLVGNQELFLGRVKIALTIEPKFSQYYSNLSEIEKNLQEFGINTAYENMKKHMYKQFSQISMHTMTTFLHRYFLIAIQSRLIQFDRITKIHSDVYTDVISSGDGWFFALKSGAITVNDLETLKPFVLKQKIESKINPLKSNVEMGGTVSKPARFTTKF